MKTTCAWPLLLFGLLVLDIQNVHGKNKAKVWDGGGGIKRLRQLRYVNSNHYYYDEHNNKVYIKDLINNLVNDSKNDIHNNYDDAIDNSSNISSNLNGYNSDYNRNIHINDNNKNSIIDYYNQNNDGSDSNNNYININSNNFRAENIDTSTNDAAVIIDGETASDANSGYLKKIDMEHDRAHDMNVDEAFTLVIDNLSTLIHTIKESRQNNNANGNNAYVTSRNVNNNSSYDNNYDNIVNHINAMNHKLSELEIIVNRTTDTPTTTTITTTITTTTSTTATIITTTTTAITTAAVGNMFDMRNSNKISNQHHSSSSSTNDNNNILENNTYSDDVPHNDMNGLILGEPGSYPDDYYNPIENYTGANKSGVNPIHKGIRDMHEVMDNIALNDVFTTTKDTLTLDLGSSSSSPTLIEGASLFVNRMLDAITDTYITPRDNK